MTLLFLFGMFGGYIIDKGAGEKFLEPFNIIRYLGIIVILIGVLIRVNTIIKLGNAFSVNIGVHEDQKLLKTGLFKYIRHPAYFGIFLTFVGISISFYNPVTTSFGIIFPFIGLMYRIYVEEKLLVKYFGDEYKQYQKETKKLIPFII
jgi:protein-S-isoprenylcysteine O-methyltransferase Ste14